MTKTKQPDTFATRLGALRAEAKLSIYALAKLTGISRQYLGDLERGEKQPSLDVAKKIAAAFGKGLGECWE